MRRKAYVAALVGISICAFTWYGEKRNSRENVTDVSKEEHGFFHENEEEEREEEAEREGHQTGADKQLQGWFWNKGYPNPENLGGKYMAAYEEYLDIKANTEKILKSTNSRTNGYGNWAQVGSSVAGIGGRVVCIAINPTSTSTLVVGTASGGLYKTTNGGTSWQYLPTGFPVLGIGAVTYHPTNGNILLAGTGEVYRVDGTTDRGNVGFNVWKTRGTYGIGMLRSTDGGTTWTQVMTKQTSHLFAIQEIAYDPVNPNIVYACATDGLYKSTDGGVTWPASPLYSATYVRDIVINPANTQQMVISVGNLSNATIGLYRTVNGGTSWTACTGLSAGPNGYIRIVENGSRLYASVGIGGTADELCMSNDFGATWSIKTGSAHCGGQYWFGHALAVDPTNANKIIMGGVNYYTYTSTNTTTGGTRATTGASMHADVHDIEYVPGSASVVYVANDGGMYKSIDGGASFSAINSGLNAVQFYASFAVSPTNANVMIGGLQDNGVVKWDGTNWTSVVGGDGGPSMFHPKNGNKVLYSNDARTVYYSGDAGVTETKRLINLGYGYASAYDDRTAFMSPIGMSYPTTAPNGIVMYAASDNLHISTDSGGSFSRSDPATAMTRYIDLINKPAIALAVSQTNRDKVYVSTSPLSQRADDNLNVKPPARVMRSLNASDNTNYSFTDIGTALPDRMTTDFAISRFSDDSVYITMGGFGAGHVWLTPDGGTTWLNRSSGLPDVPFNAILVDPVRPNIIYAGCDFGVYVSSNRGLSWFDYNSGFPETVMVMDLQATADKKLVAASHGKSIFRADLFVPPAVLPVSYAEFTGRITSTGNQLDWTTSSEVSLSKFVVERSEDGFRYTAIKNVVARSVIVGSSYRVIDESRETQVKSFYYRIKAINTNGAYQYSSVVYLTPPSRQNFTVLGNPFRSELSFRLKSTTTVALQVALVGIDGRILRNEQKTANTGIQHFSLQGLGNLPAGEYILRVRSGKETFTERVIKK